jgi:hypothetical protein
MRAYGAELVLTPKAGGMEHARDVAAQMRDEGKGVILDQFANPRQSARALPRDGTGDLARHRGPDHALRLGDGDRPERSWACRGFSRRRIRRSG